MCDPTTNQMSFQVKVGQNLHEEYFITIWCYEYTQPSYKKPKKSKNFLKTK